MRITAFDVLADMFLESTFDEEELEKEKRVVIEEIKMYEDTPDDLVHELLADCGLRRRCDGTPDSRYRGERQTTQPANDCRVSQEAYAPEQIVISVAGHVTDELITQIKNRFGSLQSSGKRSDKLLSLF